MSAILSTVLSAVSSGFVKLLTAALVAVKEVFKYLNNKRNDKKEADRKVAVENANKKIDEACDKGTLDDLLNASHELGKVKK